MTKYEPAVVPKKDIPAWVERLKKQLPISMQDQSERLVMRASIYFQKEKKLHRCTLESKLLAMLEAGDVGLPLDGRLAYAIPYGEEAKFQASYIGMILVARRAGVIKDAKADIIKEGEKAIYKKDDTGERFLHEYSPVGRSKKKTVAAYCELLFHDGRRTFTFVDQDEIERIRSCSKGANSDAWRKFYDQMAMKCPVRRALKAYQEAPEIRQVLETDEEHYDMGDVDSRPLPNLAGESEEKKPEVIEVESVRDIEAWHKAFLEKEQEAQDLGIDTSFVSLGLLSQPEDYENAILLIEEKIQDAGKRPF